MIVIYKIQGFRNSGLAFRPVCLISAQLYSSAEYAAARPTRLAAAAAAGNSSATVS